VCKGEWVDTFRRTCPFCGEGQVLMSVKTVRARAEEAITEALRGVPPRRVIQHLMGTLGRVRPNVRTRSRS
jgi:aerobic-type carbon monoxide dehydrogenase small subunit (CoxS/CutS family)